MRIGFAVLVSSLVAACASESTPPRRPVAYPNYPAPVGVARNFAQSVQSLRFPPIDLSRIVPAAGRGPCSPLQVAPGRWIAPDCSQTFAQPLARSPFVPRHQSFSQFNLKAEAPLPPAVDLRVQGLDGPVKSQEMVGICWAFAMSTVMDNAIRRAGRQDVIAPLHVLSSHLWRDVWQNGRSERAITLEPSWPYDPVKACKLNEDPGEIWCEEAYHVKPGSWRSDPALVAEVDRANRSGAFKVTKIESLDVRPGNPDQIARILVSGKSIWAAFDFDREAWGDSGNSNPVLPDWEGADGGHAVVLVGYRTTPSGRQFLLHNSWGSDWRERGYAWVSEAMVRRHLMDAFTLEVSNPNKLEIPRIDPVATSSNDCPPGVQPDSLLGFLCRPATTSPSGPTRGNASKANVTICPNGFPAIAGVCFP
jgi:hypothetical protein